MSSSVRQHLDYPHQELAARVAEWLDGLTHDQRAAYDAVLHGVVNYSELRRQDRFDASPRGHIHFVRSPGGCGKTHLFNLLLDSVRSRVVVALATGSSGICSILLHDGMVYYGILYPKSCY